jgi:hypothetical protein
VKHDLLPEAKEDRAASKLLKLFNKGGDMLKFDAVIGNPPYMDHAKQQIYTNFYITGKQIANNMSLIFPIGWQEPKTANGLAKMNVSEVKEDPQIVSIDNRQNVFHGIAGAEWTNIILWQRDYDNGLDGKQLILTNGKNPTTKKLIMAKSDIKKPDEIRELFTIVTSRKDFKSIQLITSVRKPYGLSTDVIKDPSKYKLPAIQDKKENDSDIKIYVVSGKLRFVPKDYPFPKMSKAFHKYKVFIPYAWGNMSESAGLGGAYSDIIIAEPNSATTETYLESGRFDDFATAKKHAKYLMTQFARALLYVNKHSQHSTTSWGAIPIQDYSESWWDKSIAEIDEELITKYNIPENIEKFIRKNIQVKTESNITNFESHFKASE